jgi:hypothetical protein
VISEVLGLINIKKKQGDFYLLYLLLNKGLNMNQKESLNEKINLLQNLQEFVEAYLLKIILSNILPILLGKMAI